MSSLTRMAILSAFAELAMEKTVDKITVKDITDRCSISRNTFYYHFKDVYEVLEVFLDMEAKRVTRMIEEDMGHIDEEEACLKGFEYMLTHRSMFYNLYQSAGKDEVKKYLDQTAAALFSHQVNVLSEGIPASEGDRELISRFYGYAMKGFLVEWLEGKTDRPAEKVIHRMGTLFRDNMIESLKRSAENPE